MFLATSRPLPPLLAILNVLVSSLLVQAKLSGFYPLHWIKASTTCPAVNRAENNTAVELKLSYVDINPGPAVTKGKPTLLMVHGWPGLWSTWAYQIQEFKKEYRLIIPDLRGFGESEHPGDVKSSGAMQDMVSDLACILQKAKVSAEGAICIGHDWGSSVCYEAARERPDIFVGVVGIDVPYIPADGPFVPIKALTPRFPKLQYQTYFDEHTADAVKELDKNIKRSLRSTLRAREPAPPQDFLTSDSSFLGAWADVKAIPKIPFLSEAEETYLIEQYEIQGFKNTLQFYTTQNRYLSWEFAHNQGNFTIPVPVLAVYPTDDRVADWVTVAEVLGSEKYLPRLTVETVAGAHWPHLESPIPVNTVIRNWLKSIEEEREREEQQRPKPPKVSVIYDEEAGTTKTVTEETRSTTTTSTRTRVKKTETTTTRARVDDEL